MTGGVFAWPLPPVLGQLILRDLSAFIVLPIRFFCVKNFFLPVLQCPQCLKDVSAFIVLRLNLFLTLKTLITAMITADTSMQVFLPASGGNCTEQENLFFDTEDSDKGYDNCGYVNVFSFVRS